VSAPRPEPARIVALDQFRGYTVLGMFVVNFVGSFKAVPAVLKHHHTYCSYADTIMPQFFLAVGFAYRLTLLRRLERDGRWAAYAHVIRRSLGLILLGIVLYGLGKGPAAWAEFTGPQLGPALRQGLKREVFQTLTHIGVTSLWVLPVMAAGPLPRVAFLLGSSLLHLWLSDRFYYAWVNAPPVGIDGGPLGFLTWTVPLLVGSLACDAVLREQRGGPSPVWRFVGWAVVLMLAGYALSCLNRVTPPNSYTGRPADLLAEPPFVPPADPDAKNLWTMSQRSGSVSYLVFAAGFSLLVYALFALAWDAVRLRVGVFDTLGKNALAGYVLHGLVDNPIKAYVPRDAPLWYVAAALAVFLGVCYVFLRYLEKEKLFLRL
jgi:predicted acyltransferase